MVDQPSGDTTPAQGAFITAEAGRGTNKTSLPTAWTTQRSTGLRLIAAGLPEEGPVTGQTRLARERRSGDFRLRTLTIGDAAGVGKAAACSS